MLQLGGLKNEQSGKDEASRGESLLDRVDTNPPVDTLAGRLARAPMSRLQVGAVAMSVALSALDGFDVLAITFAAPGIAADWGTKPAALGVALSSGLVGMAGGSLFIAPRADRFGRRPILPISLMLMAIGMLMTATAQSLWPLCAWRVITGLGIGALVPTVSTIAAEFANDRRRDFAVALVTVGYPAGGLVGGLIAAQFVTVYGWRSIFVFGGVITAVFLPLAWWLVPESIQHLARTRTPRADKVFASVLRRMGHDADEVIALPFAASPASQGSAGGFAELLSPAFRRMTLLLIAAYCLHILTFYFFSGWLPKLMTDMGFSTPDAIRTSAIMSLGGIVGGSMLGFFAPRLGLRRLVIAAMITTTLTMGGFGYLTQLHQIQLLAVFVGIGIFGGIVGLYAALARAFPARLRVTGTGLAIGLGRGGAVVGPILGGVLLQAGLRAGTVMSVVALFALAAAFAFALALPAKAPLDQA